MQYKDQINEALRWMEDHIREDITLERAAAQTDLSVAEFEQIFAFFIGNSVRDYLRLRRISLAVEDLMNTADTISSIARRFGYSSEVTFCKAFTAVQGVTPRRARHGDCPLFVSNIPYLTDSDPSDPPPEFAPRTFAAPYRAVFRGPFPRLSDAVRSLGSNPITEPGRFVDGSPCFDGSSAAYAWDERIEEPGTTSHYPHVFRVETSTNPFFTEVAYSTPRRIDGIILMTCQANFEEKGQLPKNWVLSGSNDLKEWVDIAAGDGAELIDCDYMFFAAGIKTSDPYRCFRFRCYSATNLFLEFNRIILTSPEAPAQYEDVFHFAGACINEEKLRSVPLLKNSGREYASPEEAALALGLDPVTRLRFVWGNPGLIRETGPENLWIADPALPYICQRNPAASVVEADEPFAVGGIILTNAPEQEAEPQRCPGEWQLLGLGADFRWEIVAHGDARFLGMKGLAVHAARISAGKKYRVYQFRFRSHQGIVSHLGRVVLCREVNKA